MSITSVRIGAVVLVLAALAFFIPSFTHAAGPCALNVQCLSNPSFEASTGGNPTAWTRDTFPLGSNDANLSAPTTTPGHTGNSAAQIVVTTYTGTSDTKWVQNVIVSPGQYYVFSDWYKSSTSTEIDIFFTGGSQSFQWIMNVPPAADWTQIPPQGFLIPPGVTSMAVTHTLVGAGTLVTDDYSLVRTTPPTFDRGIVSLTFDDGWKSIYTNAIPILDSAISATHPGGLNSTQYITTDPVVLNHDNYGDEFMVTGDLVAMQAAGHDIAAHTRFHCSLVELSASLPGSAECPSSTFSTEIGGSRTDLTGVGMTPVDSLAYPYGQYNATVKAAVQAAGFLGARSVDQGFNFTNTDKFALKMQHVRITTTAAEVKSWIDYAIANNVWLVLMFHRIETTGGACVDLADPLITDEDCTTTAVLQEIADYLKTKPVGTTATVHQVLTNADIIPPVITRTGPATVDVVVGGSYTDQGATASDNIGGNITANIVTTVTVGAVATTSVNTAVVGTYTVHYNVADAAGNAATEVTRTVNVNPPANQVPSATAQSVTLNENSSITITLDGTDGDSDPLTFATTTNPANGTLSSIVGNQVIYTPTADYFGSDSFSFKVNDGDADSADAVVSITVNDVPPPPPPPPPSGGGGGGCGSSCGGGGSVLGLIGTVNTNPVGQVLGASTQTLTDQQINAILDLLRSFNADASVIDSVEKALRGQGGSVPSGGKFIFTKTMQMGSTGDEVTELQKRLTEEGVYSGPITGYFGSLTKAGVVAYQTAHGIAPAVGVVGPLTRAELNK